MVPYRSMTQEQLLAERDALQKEYVEWKKMGLKLDMSRGKPCREQLELSMPMLYMDSLNDMLDEKGIDVRNYGQLAGIPEARELFADMLGVLPKEVIVGGNSSLNMMYDMFTRAMLFGFPESPCPWKDCGTIKFLCPVPGYDRHFAICQQMGIEMINVPMTPTGPDMDQVEKLVAADPQIKGIWCVPKYSNPQGITYSDETVRRFARMKTAAPDFKIFWDNAYCMHHLTDHPDQLLNLMEESKRCKTEDRVLMFASTSKITFAGAGIAVFASSEKMVEYVKQLMNIQIISYDKVAQLRHVRFLKDINHMTAHMKQQSSVIAPKFRAVLDLFEEELGSLGIAEWTKPNGGYFISFDAMNGCAKRIVGRCMEAGVILTPAGATYPYGLDPEDRNIRIAPTYPPIDELLQAAKLFCLCVKLTSVEKLLEQAAEA